MFPSHERKRWLAPMSASAVLHMTLLGLVVAGAEAWETNAHASSPEAQLIWVEAAASMAPAPELTRPKSTVQTRRARARVRSSASAEITGMRESSSATEPASSTQATSEAASSGSSSGVGDLSLTGLAHGGGDPYFAALLSRLQSRHYYPAEAERRGEQGVVEIRFRLSKDGRIEDAQVKSASPFGDLNEAALQTVLRLRRFQPIPDRLGGEGLTLVVPFVFKLQHG